VAGHRFFQKDPLVFSETGCARAETVAQGRERRRRSVPVSPDDGGNGLIDDAADLPGGQLLSTERPIGGVIVLFRSETIVGVRQRPVQIEQDGVELL
jgi:hypothetical protein